MANTLTITEHGVSTVVLTQGSKSLSGLSDTSLSSPTIGDIIYWSGSAWVKSSPGTVNTALTSTGVGSVPVWSPLPGTGLATQSVATDTLLTLTDAFTSVDATASMVTISFPTAVGNDGKVFHILKKDASANVVRLDPDGAELINDEATRDIQYQHTVLSVVSDGVGWRII